MIADAVFQGGGMKAIGFVGAICRLEEENIQWQRVAGTSAGALIASLLAVGYTGKELKKIMYELDYSKLANRTIIQKIPLLGKPLGMIIEKGIFNTDDIEKFLISLYRKKGKLKFRDISYNGKSRLKIIASDVTNKRLLILPDDIKRYGIDPMEFEIARAVIMSISIPFIFNPVKLKYMGKENFIVDGGLTSNYPIWIFDVKGTPRWPTLGFKFENNPELNVDKTKVGFCSYIIDVIETVIDCYDESYLKDEDKIRTISIPTKGVKTTDFNININKRKELFQSGYKKANEFLINWDFNSYKLRYR